MTGVDVPEDDFRTGMAEFLELFVEVLKRRHEVPGFSSRRLHGIELHVGDDEDLVDGVFLLEARVAVDVQDEVINLLDVGVAAIVVGRKKLHLLPKGRRLA